LKSFNWFRRAIRIDFRQRSGAWKFWVQ
jgi:hypothetical protein